MPKGPLIPSEFVPTKFSSAADKAEFGNVFLHFLDADCSQELFTKKLFNRLSMTFGHIAHYDRAGFYDTWFAQARHKAAFIEKILRWPCHGDPEYTLSDVEQALQRVVRWKLLQRNVEYHLSISDVAERDGEETVLGRGRLAVTVECGSAGYLKIGPRLGLLSKRPKDWAPRSTGRSPMPSIASCGSVTARISESSQPL